MSALSKLTKSINGQFNNPVIQDTPIYGCGGHLREYQDGGDLLAGLPDNAILNRKLGEAYDGILLDDKNYIK